MCWRNISITHRVGPTAALADKDRTRRERLPDSALNPPRKDGLGSLGFGDESEAVAPQANLGLPQGALVLDPQCDRAKIGD